MKRLMIALSVSAALGLALPAAAQMTSTNAPLGPLSKDGYATAKKDAGAQYKIDKEACASLSSNTKDICMAQAKGKEASAKADANAAYENTPKARPAACAR